MNRETAKQLNDTTLEAYFKLHETVAIVGNGCEVPCRPGIIPDNVTLMAVQSHSGHIVTDENQDELRNVAPLAAVFIQFNEQASYQNAAVMASKYG